MMDVLVFNLCFGFDEAVLGSAVDSLDDFGLFEGFGVGEEEDGCEGEK